jgi:AcrR family transcriptional regulator
MTSTPLSIAPRRERNALESQRRILDAAEIEFAAKGFDGARLGSIARAADAQAALIHHYFEDKAGLYRAVIARALESLSAEGWDILAEVKASTPPPPLPVATARTARKKAASKVSAAKAPTGIDLAKLVDAFVESMLRFYSTHARVLAILRHEAHGGGALAAGVVRSSVQPVFDAVVGLMEDLRARGEVRADVDARHACISAVAMACWPYQEERFLSMVFPVDVHSARFREERRADIVATILGRILPRT